MCLYTPLVCQDCERRHYGDFRPCRLADASYCEDPLGEDDVPPNDVCGGQEAKYTNNEFEPCDHCCQQSDSSSEEKDGSDSDLADESPPVQAPDEELTEPYTSEYDRTSEEADAPMEDYQHRSNRYSRPPQSLEGPCSSRFGHPERGSSLKNPVHDDWSNGHGQGGSPAVSRLFSTSLARSSRALPHPDFGSMRSLSAARIPSGMGGGPRRRTDSFAPAPREGLGGPHGSLPKACGSFPLASKDFSGGSRSSSTRFPDSLTPPIERTKRRSSMFARPPASGLSSWSQQNMTTPG